MSLAAPDAVATLEFDRNHLVVGSDTDIRQGLSAVVLDSTQLWLACDEGCRLERLTRSSASELHFGSTAIDLSDFLALPADAKEEADIERPGHRLWMAVARRLHSVKRRSPKRATEAEVATVHEVTRRQQAPPCARAARREDPDARLRLTSRRDDCELAGVERPARRDRPERKIHT
jgi:hypothetical protein